MMRPGGAAEDLFRPSGADFLHAVFFRWRRSALATGYPLPRLRR